MAQATSPTSDLTNLIRQRRAAVFGDSASPRVGSPSVHAGAQARAQTQIASDPGAGRGSSGAANPGAGGPSVDKLEDSGAGGRGSLSALIAQRRKVVFGPQAPATPPFLEPGDPGYEDERMPPATGPMQFATPVSRPDQPFRPPGYLLDAEMAGDVLGRAGNPLRDPTVPSGPGAIVGMPTATTTREREAQIQAEQARLAAGTATEQGIREGVSWPVRVAAGAAGVAGERVNEAATAWRDLINFYRGREPGQPVNVVGPGTVGELSAIGGTVNDPVGRAVMQNAPAAAELVPIDPVGLASMFLASPIVKGIRGAQGFQAARAQFLTEVQAAAGQRAASLTANAIDDAVMGGTFGGVDATLRGGNPIEGVAAGALAGVGIGGVARGVARGVGAAARGAAEIVNRPARPAPVTDPAITRAAVDAMRLGSPAKPLEATDVAVERARAPEPLEAKMFVAPVERTQNPPGSRIIRDVGRRTPDQHSPGDAALANRRPEQPVADQTQSPAPLDRPALESEATRLGVPFTRSTRTADLAAAVEERTAAVQAAEAAGRTDQAAEPQPAPSQPSSSWPGRRTSRPPQMARPESASQQPTAPGPSLRGQSPESVRPLSEGVETVASSSASPTPSPADGESARSAKSQRPFSRTSQPAAAPENPPAPLPAGRPPLESQAQTARGLPPDPASAPTLETARTEREQGVSPRQDTERPVGETLPSPQSTPRQPWEMTRGEFAESDEATDRVSLLKSLGPYEGVEIAVGGSTVGTGPKGIKKNPSDIDVVFRPTDEAYFNHNHPFWADADAMASQDGVDVWIDAPAEVSRLSPGKGSPIMRLSTVGERAARSIKSALPIGGVDRHRLFVETALREGRPVPPEVLADYPDLKPKQEAAAKQPWESTPLAEVTREEAAKFPKSFRRNDANAAMSVASRLTSKDGITRFVMLDSTLGYSMAEAISRTFRGGKYYKIEPTESGVRVSRVKLRDDVNPVPPPDSQKPVPNTEPVEDFGKAGRRRVLQNRLERGAQVPPSMLDEFKGEPWVDSPADQPKTPAPAQETRVEGAGEVTPAESPRAAEEGQVERWDVYPVQVRGMGTRYAVRESADARGFGDTIHDTPEAAAKYARDAKEREAKNAAFRAAENQKNEQAAARKAEESNIDGFADDKPPMVKGKTVKALQALARIDGKVASIRDHVRAMVAAGDVGLTTRQEPKIKPMSRAAFNRADGRQQAAHEAKMKAGGTKTVYLVNGRDLGKTAYEYAEYLRDKPKSPPPPTTGSFADRLEAKARQQIAAIDADVAAKRKNRKPGQRLGAAPVTQYAVLYAQIGVAKALRVAEKGVERVRRVSAYIREEMRVRGVIDSKLERKAVRIAKAMMKEATGSDGTIDPAKLRQVISEADTEINTIRTPKGKAATRQAVKDATEGMLTPGQALKGAMEREAKAVDRLASGAVRAIRQTEREARREGRREATEALSLKIDDLRERARRDIFRERIRGRMTTSEAIRRADYQKALADHVDTLRTELVDTIEAVVRPEAQAGLLAKVPKVKTRQQFERVLNDVGRVVNDSLVRQAKADAKQARKLTGQRKLSALSKDRASAAQVLAAEAQRLARDETLTGRERATKVRRTLDAIEVLHFEQKHENRVYINGRKRQADAERANAINALSKRKPMGETTDARDEAGNAGMLKRWYHRAMIPRVLARYLDGAKTGPFQRIIKTFDRARTDGLDLEREFFQKADAIVKGLGYQSWADFMARVSGTLGRGSQEMVKVKIGDVDQISKGQAMYILAMDPETKSAAARGQTFNFKTRPDAEPFQLTNQIRQDIYDALTPEEINAVTLLKKLKEDQHLDKLDDISMRYHGKRLERVPEHWSIERNRRKMDRGVPKTWQQAWIKHGEDAGFFKDREGGKVPIMIGDFGQDLTSRVRSEAFIISHADAVRAAEQILLHPDVTSAVASRVGSDVNTRLESLMQELSGAAADDRSMGWLYRPARSVVANVSAALTQVNPLTWARNLGGLVMLPARLAVNPKYTAAGLKAMGTVRVGELVTDSPIFWERYTRGSHTIFDPVRGAQQAGEAGFLRAGSATVREAAASVGNALALRGRAAVQRASGAADAWSQFREAMRWGNWFDSAAARFTLGYKLAEAQDKYPGLSADKQRAWALRQTERAFTETQNTSDPLNSSGFAAAGRRNPFVGAALSFTGDVAKKQNLIIEGVLEYQETGNFKPLVRNVALVGLSTLLSSYLVAVGWGKTRQMLGGEEENLSKMEETRDRALWQASKELVTSLLPGGGAAGWGIGLVERALKGPRRGDDFIDVPALSVAGEFVDAGQRMLSAIDDMAGEVDEEKQAKAIDRFNLALSRAGKSGGTLIGAPVPPINMVTSIVKARRESDLAAMEDAMAVLRKRGETSGGLYREMSEIRRAYRNATPEQRAAMAERIRNTGRTWQRLVRGAGEETPPTASR